MLSADYRGPVNTVGTVDLRNVSTSSVLVRCGVSISDPPASDRSGFRRTRGRTIERPVAPIALPATVVHATGPSGTQPKKRLTPGVCTITARAIPLPITVAQTSGLVRPTRRVWPNRVPT